MTFNICWIFLGFFLATQAQHLPPSILEDARVHPSGDGSFGFLYRTQDGIAHAAKGDPGGAVHGRFTYTDPTGLKVNFNYNAGAQALQAKQAQQNQQTQAVQSRPQPSRPIYVPQEEQNYRPEPARYETPKYPAPPRSRYVQPQPQPRYQQFEESRYEPRYEPRYQPRYESSYEERDYESTYQPKTKSKYVQPKYSQYEEPDYEPESRQNRPSAASQNYVQDYEQQYYTQQ